MRNGASESLPVEVPTFSSATAIPTARTSETRPVITQAVRQKLDLNLLSALARGDNEPQRVIVQARAGAERVVADALSARGVTFVGQPGGNTIVATATADAIASLADDNRVARISTDAVVMAAQSGRFTDGEVLAAQWD